MTSFLHHHEGVQHDTDIHVSLILVTSAPRAAVQVGHLGMLAQPRNAQILERSDKKFLP
jgi:hypothetical protein